MGLERDSQGKFYVTSGSRFDGVIGQAKEFAGELGSIITFEFNSVTIKIGPTTDLALIRREWDRLNIVDKSEKENIVVGPYPIA